MVVGLIFLMVVGLPPSNLTEPHIRDKKELTRRMIENIGKFLEENDVTYPPSGIDEDELSDNEALYKVLNDLEYPFQTEILKEQKRRREIKIVVDYWGRNLTWDYDKLRSAGPDGKYNNPEYDIVSEDDIVCKLSLPEEKKEIPLIEKPETGDCKNNFYELTLRDVKGKGLSFVDIKHLCGEDWQGGLHISDPYNKWEPKDYDFTLAIYDSNEKIIDQYSLNSKRTLFWDDFDNEGRIIDGGSVELISIIDECIIHAPKDIKKITATDNKTGKEKVLVRFK